MPTSDPGQPSLLNHQGAVAMQAGRIAEALGLFERAVALAPDSPDFLCNLGGALYTAGQMEAAVTTIRRAVALRPDFVMGLYNLAMAASAAGQFEEAMSAFQRAVALNNDAIPRTLLSEAIYNFGNGLRSAGRMDAAIDAYRLCLSVRSNYAHALNNLGSTYQEIGRAADAAESYRAVLRLQPDFAEVWSNLGNSLQHLDQLDEAIAALRRAIELRPDYVNAYWNLASALNEVGDLSGTVAALEKSIALRPADAVAASYRLLALHAMPNQTPRELLREHRRWNDAFAAPPARVAQPHVNDRSPDRRLRIGYVSADFREHVVGGNLLPLIREHDRQHFEIFCYSNQARPDARTERFRSLADQWRLISACDDETAATMVRNDRIDILVDLSLHSAGNRLLLMGRKPAPIQLTFGGYPGTTGLDMIDYRLTDPHLDPTGNDEFYAEKSVRVAHSFWCYDVEGMNLADSPEVGPLPALANGYVTFGCLNKFSKVNDSVLDLWGRVLAAVPMSRLSLLAPPGSHRDRTIARLGAHGIDAGRIEFHSRRPRIDYLSLYRQIDLGLDTFPYGGHTTSLDAYWMGVPVVTIIGRSAVSRAGLSHLTNLNLRELAANSSVDFLQIATNLASDLRRLGELRRTLRQKMRDSALMDARGFARDIEAAYRRMWHQWVGVRPPESPPTFQQSE